MADANKLIPFIIRQEGGYVNDPDDSGGATMCGVTLATYRAYRKGKGLPAPTAADLKRITKKEWDDIFLTMYWDKCRAGGIISQSVANALVDWYWCSGTAAIRRVQRIVETNADGIVGAKTLAAINARQARPLFQNIQRDRLDYIETVIRRDKKKEKYRKGWTRRINALTFCDNE